MNTSGSRRRYRYLSQAPYPTGPPPAYKPPDVSRSLSLRAIDISHIPQHVPLNAGHLVVAILKADTKPAQKPIVHTGDMVAFCSTGTFCFNNREKQGAQKHRGPESFPYNKAQVRSPRRCKTTAQATKARQ